MCVCVVFFGATDQVQELELSVDIRSLDKLLDFLSCSFMGGTDVDKPLQLSLERLQKDEWQQVRYCGAEWMYPFHLSIPSVE